MPTKTESKTEFTLDVSVEPIDDGRSRPLYRVYNPDADQVIFVGTRDECGRYLEILHEKIRKHLNRKRLTRSHTKRVYRADFSDSRRRA